MSDSHIKPGDEAQISGWLNRFEALCEATALGYSGSPHYEKDLEQRVAQREFLAGKLARLSVLEAENSKLATALALYGQHMLDCPRHPFDERWGAPCECGFDAVTEPPAAHPRRDPT